MKIDKYVSSFLTADDLMEGPRLVEIEQVLEEKVGTDRKLVMYGTGLNGVGISLNKTNLKKLADILKDDDTDGWEGKTIVVYRDPHVMFGGKKVGGIAFRMPKEGYVASADPTAKDAVPF